MSLYWQASPDLFYIIDMDIIDKEYKESLDFLYSQLPMFSRVGAAAYKPGLERTIALDDLFGNPHRKFKSIHIAGTNGKGSTSAMLAAVLQAAAYKTALYTSPHLVDFRERIRINGKMIPKEKVVAFVDKWRRMDSDIRPSFFELTMTMAFDWFAEEDVDYAVVETGMGGRLDSTNIITPELCVITNISFDHTQFLGDTLAKIAGEKAGIIKRGVPVVIGEAEKEVEEVFKAKAMEEAAPLTLAYKNPMLAKMEKSDDRGWECESEMIGSFSLPLAGDYQKKNLNTVLNAISLFESVGIKVTEYDIVKGIENADLLTGFRGRWTRMADHPLTICDIGHNEDGLRYNLAQLRDIISKKGRYAKLRMVIGFVADKDVDHILPMFPKDAVYYLTNAAIPRAMKVDELFKKCEFLNLDCRSFPSVREAYKAAKNDSDENDVIYIGGSTFVVADFLEDYQK